MTTNYTYLGFDTYEDAKTFKQFLQREGYKDIMISAYDEKTRLYKVFYMSKENK